VQVGRCVELGDGGLGVTRWRAVSGDLESIRRAALTYKNALDESTVV
jgi:hypothetical protein